MFDHLGIWEVCLLLVIGIVVVGPDRLPKLIQDAGRMLRQLRRMANDATVDLREGMGVDDITGLHPRALARDFLNSTGIEEHVQETVAAVKPTGRPASPRLQPGEQPPYDADAT